jgi:hypothetical protein
VARGRQIGDRSRAADSVDTGLLELGAGVRFRHPLMRSAVYRTASAEDRRCPSSTGRRHGPGHRSRSPGLASRTLNSRARRSGRREAGAVGRPGAAPGRRSGGRRVPGTVDQAHSQPGLAGSTGTDRGARQIRGGRAGQGIRAARNREAGSARRASAGAAGAAARTDRVENTRQPCSAPAAHGRTTTRAARRRAST